MDLNYYTIIFVPSYTKNFFLFSAGVAQAVSRQDRGDQGVSIPSPAERAYLSWHLGGPGSAFLRERL